MAGDERQFVEAPALEQLKGMGLSHLDGTTLVPGTFNHRSSLKEAEAVMHGFLKELGYL